MKKILISIPLAILAILAVGAFAAPSVQAHDGVASGTCNGGVQWDYHNYDKTVTNSITVTIDGVVRYTDGDFKASDTGQIATDKTMAHVWDVLVNAPGTQYDRHPNGWQPDGDPRLPLSVREILRVARKYAVAQHGMPLDQIDRAEQWIVDTMRVAYLAEVTP